MRRTAPLLFALLGCAHTEVSRLPHPTSAAPTVLRDDRPPAFESGTVDADTQRALDALAREAERTHSDAVLILKEGRVVLDRSFTARAAEPMETMSVTKSIAALAVALLLDDQHIGALDVPLTRWFPEWKQGRKQQITLLHLLTHTTGLHEASSDEIWQSPDFVQLALAAELEHDPGGAYHYNNEAANLLGEIVRREVGEPIDRLLRRRLFDPLGIERLEWLHDPAGHPLVQSGLKLRSVDLARIGEVLRGRGSYRGRRYLSERALGVVLAPRVEAKGNGLFFWRAERGAYAARGYLGQVLLVWPDAGVVAVRQRQWVPGAQSGVDDFADFEKLVFATFSKDPR